MADCDTNQQVKCEHRLTSIEEKLDTLIQNRKTAVSRIWDLAKLALSAAVGVIAGLFAGSK